MAHGTTHGRMEVAVLCTRDPGGRATGRISVLRSHLRALEALGHRVRVVVVSARAPAPSSWSARFPTTHVPAPALASVALTAAAVVALPPALRLRRARAGAPAGDLGGTRRPSTLNEGLYVDPRVRRDVAAAAAGADVVVVDGLRLSSAAALLEGTPVVVDLDDLLSDRYRRLRGTGRSGPRPSVLGIAAERVPGPLRPLAEAVAAGLLGLEARRAAAREDVVARSAAAVSLDVPEEAVAAGEGLVFLGGLDYRPNADAVRFWRDSVLPHLRRTGPVPPLHLVGHCPAPVRAELEGPDVVVDGFVDDLGAALVRRAMVAPLLDPGGVKLKVLDALAVGLPVVGTPAAFDGTGLADGLRWGATDPAELAAAVRRLLDDDELRDRLASGGRAHAAATFSHEAGARRWAEVLQQVVAPGARTGDSGARSASLR